MYQIIDKRGSGKTLRLMLVTKDNNGVFVCFNPRAMKEKAKAYGITGFDIISYDDYNHDRYDLNKKCFIDELELYIQYQYHARNLAGYSLTLED